MSDHALHYALVCVGCGAAHGDDGVMLACAACAEPALLEADYGRTPYTVRADEGIFRYRDWLPIRRTIPGSVAPIVFREAELGAAVGIADLWVAFSGYWPERGCRMRSATFKELEAFAVLARVPADAGVLAIASAGNTAVAFATACAAAAVRCLLVVPEHAVDLVCGIPAEPGSVIVVVVAGGTYQDAIECQQWLVRRVDGLVDVGGVRNVARRDGLGVVMLAAHERMGSLPEFYFQGVGSAAGALGAYRAAARLRGPSTEPLPRMMLCQNEEFAPIHRRWQFGADEDRVVPAGDEVFAPELTNAVPPYEIAGGIRDMLNATSGNVFVSDRKLSEAGARMLRDILSIEVAPATGVAVACLRDAVATGAVPRDGRVLLNITGGVSGRPASGGAISRTAVDLVIARTETRSVRTALDVDRLIHGGPRPVRATGTP